MAYSKNTWATGDVITAEKLNSIENAVGNVSSSIDSLTPSIARIDNIENTIESINSEIASARNYNNSGATNTLGGRIDELVRISNTQPGGNNEIWVNSNSNTIVETQVPTYNEFEALRDSIINIATPYVINDAYISTQGITDVRSLPVDRAFIFQNVTVSNIANMPPVVGATVSGVLISYRGYTDKRYGTSYIYMTSQGLIYTGIDMNTGNIRWKNYAEKSTVDSLSSAVDGLTSNVTTLVGDTFRTFSVTLTDSWLSDNGITNARQLQKNRVYIFSGVTKTSISSMPNIPATAYNGALLYFKQNINAFSPLLFVNNLGECWTGIDTGSEIRWRKTSTESLDDSLSGFHNKKVLILGDSIVYGSHMTDYSPGSRTVVTLSDGTVYKNNLSTTVWSAKFIDYIAQNYGVTTVNNAWPGARYQDLVTYYDQIVTDTFDYVIICMGVNNWNSGTSVLTSLRSLKTSFDAAATKMIIMTPLGSTTYASQLGVIRDFIKTWGKENSIEIGDLYSTFNFLNYIQGHTLSEVLLDGIHYKDSAQTDICEAVKKTLHL